MDRIITKISMGFALLMVALSVVAAVYGYEVDDNIYRLSITQVKIDDTDSVSFRLTNNRRIDFDLSEIHSFTIETQGAKYSGKFSHTTDGVAPMVGLLEESEWQMITLPFSPDSIAGFSCGEPVTMEMVTFKGRLVARWVDIPSCSLAQPRPVGLVQIDPCKAEFYDGSLRIGWELKDVDFEDGRVMIEKTAGIKSPVTSWYPSKTCADLESGSCMTDVTDVKFEEGAVFVTLRDNRLGTSVTLSNVDDIGSPCLRKAQAAVIDVPKETIIPPGVAVAQPVQVARSVPVSDLREESFRITQDQRDTRVCLEGCSDGETCHDEGTRLGYLGQDVYCKGQSWIVQKRLGKSCGFDFECSSDNCINDLCSQAGMEKPRQGWITRMLLWIDNLI